MSQVKMFCCFCFFNFHCYKKNYAWDMATYLIYPYHYHQWKKLVPLFALSETSYQTDIGMPARNSHTIYRGFLATMVYLYYKKLCLRDTILVGNPRYCGRSSFVSRSLLFHSGCSGVKFSCTKTNIIHASPLLINSELTNNWRKWLIHRWIN